MAKELEYEAPGLFDIASWTTVYAAGECASKTFGGHALKVHLDDQTATCCTSGGNICAPTRRLKPSAQRRLILKTYTLKVEFTATFATKADSDAALLQVTGSPARLLVANLIQSKLRVSSNSVMWSGVTVEGFEAEEEQKSTSACDTITNEKAHELCLKAENNKMAVIGGVIGGVVFLAILAKCWHKFKYKKPASAATPDTAVPVQLALAKTVSVHEGTV